jgi:hypothetical protein
VATITESKKTSSIDCAVIVLVVEVVVEGRRAALMGTLQKGKRVVKQRTRITINMLCSRSQRL